MSSEVEYLFKSAQKELTIAAAHVNSGKAELRRLKKIVQQKSEPTPTSWISVDDELPEDNTVVLVSGSNNTGLVEMDWLQTGEWFALSCEDSLLPEVSHWMYVPEAPFAELLNKNKDENE